MIGNMNDGPLPALMELLPAWVNLGAVLGLAVGLAIVGVVLVGVFVKPTLRQGPSAHWTERQPTTVACERDDRFLAGEYSSRGVSGKMGLVFRGGPNARPIHGSRRVA